MVSLACFRIRFASAASVGLLLAAGCSKVPLKEQAALAALEAGAKGRAVTSEAGHVVKLTAPDMTDELAKELPALPHLESLTLSGSRITDSGLAALAELKSVHTLLLDGTQIGDAGLKALAALPQLQNLNLAGCPITDDGLAELAALTDLRMLNLGQTKVTGAGLKHLAALTKLESLYLQDTPVNFETVESLTPWKNLKLLQLAGSQVDGSIVRVLPGLTGLERLYLNGTRIRDEDMPALAAVLSSNSRHLKGLFLEDNRQLSDASVEPLGPLASLPDLALIHVFDTGITKDGVIRLCKMLPEANIVSPF